MGYEARIERDSISLLGHRLTTFVVTYPEIIHNEMLTHRVFSRNSSSSRAVPIKRLIEQVLLDPFIPVAWGRNQPGMQAKEELGDTEQQLARQVWLEGRDYAVAHAQRLDKIGVHKQVVNRLLQPWKFITTIISSTSGLI